MPESGFPDIVLLAVGVLITNLLWPIFAVSLVTYRLSATPDHLQGRVNSAFRTLSFGVEPLGLAIGGALIASQGPRFLFWAAAVGLFAFFLGGVAAWRGTLTPESAAAASSEEA